MVLECIGELIEFTMIHADGATYFAPSVGRLLHLGQNSHGRATVDSEVGRDSRHRSMLRGQFLWLGICERSVEQ